MVRSQALSKARARVEGQALVDGQGHSKGSFLESLSPYSGQVPS